MQTMFLNTEETTLLCIFKIFENIQCETIDLINQIKLLMPHIEHTRVNRKDTFSSMKAILLNLAMSVYWLSILMFVST